MLYNLNLKQIIIGITASVTVSGLIIGLRHQGSFEQSELLAYDSLIRLKAKSGSDTRITIVGIDDNSLRRLNSDKISDRKLQEVIATIEQYNPKVISIDIIRDIPIGEGRQQLIDYVNNRYQPLEAAIKPIIFPCALPSENKPNGIAPPPVIDLDSAIGFVDLDTDPQNIFGGEVIRRASISSIPVNNGSETASESQFDAGSADYLCNAPFSFSFITALSYIQAQQIATLAPNATPDITKFLDISNITEGEIEFKSLTFKPLKAKAGGYRNLDPSVYQHLIDYRYTQPGEVISLTKVLDNQITPEQFKDKVVLIGYLTKEDIHLTPFGLRPGVLVHGWIVSQLLRNVIDEQPQIATWSEPIEWLWIMVWGVAGSMVALGVRPLAIFIGSQGIAIAVIWVSGWLLFTQYTWIPLIPPILSFAIACNAVKIISDQLKKRESLSIPQPEATPPFPISQQTVLETGLANRKQATYIETESPQTQPTYVETEPPDIRQPTYVETEPPSTKPTYVETEPPSTKPTYVETDSPDHKPTYIETEPLSNPIEAETPPSQTARPSFQRPEDPFIEKTIGDGDRYLLKKLLGQGGMSKVYIGLDKKLNNKKVAIKIMTSYSSSNNQHLIKRFMREVESLCLLNHPNIIQITDYGLTPKKAPFSGDPFYVMEYFVGQTLQEILDQNPKIPLAPALKIIQKICYGLKDAHQKGIIHRDLKPDNIFLISGSTLGEIVKIIDFGIAKKIEEENSQHTSLTMVNTFIGTYRYASPEQCRGLSIDSRTDIYSLGVVFYEILTGHHPYNIQDNSNTTKADWIASHLTETPTSLRERTGCENIPVELENIVMKCLEKLPQKRYQNIEELEQALSDYS